MTTVTLNHTNCSPDFASLRVGSVLVVQRRGDTTKFVAYVDSLDATSGARKVFLSRCGPVIDFDAYERGESYVHRLWLLPDDVKITDLVNNNIPFL